MNDKQVMYTKQEVTEAYRLLVWWRDAYCGKAWDAQDKFEMLKAFNIALDAMGRMETME